MIAEMFDESLILLKDQLCWNLQDILYIKMNERTGKHISTMTQKTREILKHWLWADYQLYDIFKEKLEESLKNLNQEYLKNQLSVLNYLNQDLLQKCHIKEVENSQIKTSDSNHMANDMVKAFNVTGNCSLYVTSEPAFVNLIRKSMFNKKKLKA